MPQTPPLGQLSNVAAWFARNRLSWAGPALLIHAVTEACNARCPYCVFRHGKRRPDELSVAEIEALYDEAHDIGVRYVHLWGGEPLVHPRIGDIVAAAKGSGLLTGLVTNGMFLARRAAEIVPNLDRLYVSVDHPSPEHDRMRATPRLFASLLEGVARVRELNPRQAVVFNMTLCRDNATAIDDMARLCRDLHVRLYVAPMRGDSNSDVAASEVHNEDRLLPWDEQRPIWDRLLELRRLGFPILNTVHYMRLLAKGGPPVYRCHWPKLALGVEANGDLTDCQDWAHPVANVRDGLLRDLVNHPRLAALRGEVGEACSRCAVPARVEPSRFWGLHPAVVSGAIEGLAFRRRAG